MMEQLPEVKVRPATFTREQLRAAFDRAGVALIPLQINIFHGLPVTDDQLYAIAVEYREWVKGNRGGTCVKFLQSVRKRIAQGAL